MNLNFEEQIEHLIALQDVDNAIQKVDADVEEAPKKLEDIRKRFDEIERQRRDILDRIETLKENERRLERETMEESDRRRKNSLRFDQISTAREMEAYNMEMENAERSNRSRAEEKARLQEELRLADKKLQEIDDVWTGCKAEKEVREESFQEMMRSSKERRTDLEQKREAVAEGIQPPVLNRYEFIRKRLSHPVIVPVTRSICSGCHISIPPQTYIELQGRKKILNCPNCQRLIYFKAPEEKEPEEN
ncbi:MAG: C4-type zinc ribbon domain-containing protein [Desulfovibrionaceae bacterium]|nr:C4-type zinc ribbon domain-containing protein [Desulfovibrionaceae bacterium]